ncbi:hypothetical protein BgiBS90_001289 [Biomphalaria glabrata]|nr:hypothetical protein BgiBS90_001289 [Biomphalaria glabrata]
MSPLSYTVTAYVTAFLHFHRLCHRYPTLSPPMSSLSCTVTAYVTSILHCHRLCHLYPTLSPPMSPLSYTVTAYATSILHCHRLIHRYPALSPPMSPLSYTVTAYVIAILHCHRLCHLYHTLSSPMSPLSYTVTAYVTSILHCHFYPTLSPPMSPLSYTVTSILHCHRLSGSSKKCCLPKPPGISSTCRNDLLTVDQTNPPSTSTVPRLASINGDDSLFNSSQIEPLSSSISPFTLAGINCLSLLFQKFHSRRILNSALECILRVAQEQSYYNNRKIKEEGNTQTYV